MDFVDIWFFPREAKNGLDWMHFRVYKRLWSLTFWLPLQSNWRYFVFVKGMFYFSCFLFLVNSIFVWRMIKQSESFQTWYDITAEILL